MKPWLTQEEITEALSRPARGAWIETLENSSDRPSTLVAPRKGRVD